MIWLERLRQAAESNNILFVNIWGISGSGKTNLALYMSEQISDLYKHILYIKAEDVNELRNLALKNAIIILEDFTYLAAKHSRTVDRFLRELMLVRHRVERAAIIIISHYYASVLPALRLSHVRALTSLTSTSEIKQFKALFDISALWDYYHMYINNVSKHYALINVLGRHYIVKPPLSKLYSASIGVKKSVKLK